MPLLSFIVTLLVVALGDVLAIKGGVVAILPALLCCALYLGRYTESLYWLVGLLFGQYFYVLPWAMIASLPFLVPILIAIRSRLTGQHLRIIDSIVISVLLVPVFFISGIRESMAMVGSVGWVIMVTWIRFALIDKPHRLRFGFNLR